jgi:hypothetical protein
MFKLSLEDSLTFSFHFFFFFFFFFSSSFSLFAASAPSALLFLGSEFICRFRD